MEDDAYYHSVGIGPADDWYVFKNIIKVGLISGIWTLNFMIYLLILPAIGAY